MKINRARQQESVAVFGRETSLIRDVLDNLELEHALTWLLEAISQHQSGKMDGEPWHLYQTTLFAMYVDYDNGKVRLSAALACHDADLEMSLKDFVEILSREAVKEAAPLHYTPGSSGKCIHRYRNPYFKRMAGPGTGHRFLLLRRISPRSGILSFPKDRILYGLRPFPTFSGGLSINGHGEPDKVKNAVFTLLLK